MICHIGEPQAAACLGLPARWGTVEYLRERTQVVIGGVAMPRGKRSKPADKPKPKSPTSHRVDVRLTHQDAQRVEQLVEQGHFFSKADFARTAVREKLSVVRFEPEPKEPA